MTDLATTPTTAHEGARRRALPTLAAGLIGGCLLGIIARAWMRLISEDPEFTWNGTLFIVGGFTIFGLTQSIAAVARCRARRRWKLTLVRVLGVVGTLPLFIGAGAIMLPTVVGGGLASARAEWRKATRAVCFVVAAAPVLLVGKDLVGSFGWSLHTVAGFVVLLAVYGTIIRITRFTFAAQTDGWRFPRWATITCAALLGLLFVQLTAGFIFR